MSNSQSPNNNDNDKDKDNDDRPSSTGYYRNGNFSDFGSIFPNHNPNYTVGYNTAAGFTTRTGDELNFPYRAAATSNPPPWQDPNHAWRYDDKDHPGEVYTGEGWMYGPRPRQESERVALVNAPGPLQDAGMASQSVNPFAAHDPNLPISSAAPPAPKTPAASSAPPASSSSAPQTGVWDEAALFKLARAKYKEKKGWHIIVKKFPGETEASLQAAWKLHFVEVKRIWAEYEETGKEPGQDMEMD